MLIQLKNDIEIAENYVRTIENDINKIENEVKTIKTVLRNIVNDVITAEINVRTTENDVKTAGNDDNTAKKLIKMVNTSIEKLVKTTEMISKLSKQYQNYENGCQNWKKNVFKMHEKYDKIWYLRALWQNPQKLQVLSGFIPTE